MLRVFYIFICFTLTAALGRKTTLKVNITNARELANFSLKERTPSENHAILCVLNDLDFSGVNFSPIQDFSGTFDGQGYLIKHLRPNGTNAGSLFGYSRGITIRNIVVDNSCSISNDGETKTWVGGLIGFCTGYERYCIIENNVNMGMITYNIKERELDSVAIGGIIGKCRGGAPYGCIISNCANYGNINVILSNNAEFNTFIGGIAGFMDGTREDDRNCYVYNNVNYGKISFIDHNRTLNSVYIGGITGVSQNNVTIENCVSLGSLGGNASAISGYVYGSVIFKSCYWHTELGEPFDVERIQSMYTENMKSFDDNFTLLDSGTKLTDNLNSFVDIELSERSGWLLNRKKKKVTFHVNNGKRFGLSAQLILMPDLSGGEFSGWYTNKKLSSVINLLEEVSSNKLLYSTFQESYSVKKHNTFAGMVVGYSFLLVLFFMIIGLIVFIIIKLFKKPMYSRYSGYTYIQ